MMHFKKFLRLFVAPITCIAFFLSPFTSISVSATSTSNEADFWHGLYFEHVTKEISGNGVDIGNAESTDYGITTGNYIYNKSGVTTQDVIDYVSDQYNNATGYVVESASDYADKVKNVLNRTIDGTLSVGYKSEKALRTVTDATGKVFYNVSSSEYWNGIYNRWFNNGGYKDQYVTSSNDSYNGTSVNGNFSINYIGLGGVDFNSALVQGTGNAHVSGSADMSAKRGQFVFSVTVNGNNGYWSSGHGYAFSQNGQFRVENIEYSHDTYSIYIKVNYVGSDGVIKGSDSGVLNLISSIVSAENGGSDILQPSQVGFIQYPLGGTTPIYTDTSLNPPDWTINDNGTVTVGNDDYPALIDEKEIDDNGWLDVLNLLDGEDSREMSLKDPWGNPWDTQDDGTALGGFFGNLVKDIQKMFKGIGDKIKEIFQTPIDVLSDLVEKIKIALTEFFTFSPDDLNVAVNFDFDILETIWNAFLQQLGLA